MGKVDLLVIGGGVNGAAIARDAAGRGLKVLLVEQGDLAQATSSASTKLFHGGLRYLEYYEFRLVRESLIERETLLRAMPHISWPLRFVLPHHAGLRPAWMLRLGLFIYDNLGGRKILPPARSLDLRADPAGAPLRADYRRGFEYSDCWVDDARLVVLLARDAAARGAEVRTHTRFVRAARDGDGWQAELAGADGTATVAARAVVNAAGPWVGQVVHDGFAARTRRAVRLVRGSHVVTRRLFGHDRAYIFQQPDGRIVFAIPYEGDFTLIGTTDVEHDGAPGEAACTPEERDYLVGAASGYFREPVRVEDIVWSYSGVRPLYDDGASSATAATRDYVLEVGDAGGRAPVLSVFGGKITTHRRLAEAAMAKLAPYFPGLPGAWTAAAPLPGGDFPWDGAAALAERLRAAHPFLDAGRAARLVRLYGTEAKWLLEGARTAADLGEDFGAGLSERELVWLREREWARTAEDVLWRRTKLGLRLDAGQVGRVEAFMQGMAAPEAAVGAGALPG
jgi:glycerol-3-phosphate dehydrogenase